jgi:exopolyphosphatase/guanosine-5'-triphosphate,3'-diphosphate pyrophosphatase
VVTEEDRLLLVMETNADMTLEFGMFDKHSAFFEEVFNIKPVLKQKKSNI